MANPKAPYIDDKGNLHLAIACLDTPDGEMAPYVYLEESLKSRIRFFSYLDELLKKESEYKKKAYRNNVGF